MANTLTFTSLILRMTLGIWGVSPKDGELGCLCGKAGTSHLCDGSAHSSGCVVNGSYSRNSVAGWVEEGIDEA